MKKLPHDGKRKKAIVQRLYCYALCNGGFEKIRAAVSFRLSKMNDDPTPCNLVRRHIGGCRHVNFRHSQ
ncbi:hypothetical protein DXB05_02540 [Clostridium sp. OF13-4]|nr:hypothetical protein DXB05_02540 [Clostridium sp. OF13-4]